MCYLYTGSFYGQVLKEDIISNLNPEQLEAVTHGKGPLLVIAGAGTGKTLVITRRIASLIDRGVRPERILALTFTDKAAYEMEERVDRLIPYGYTDVRISTFHAFGDAVLRDHALDIGLTPDFKVLTDPERIIFLKDNLFRFELSYYRPLGNPTKYIAAFLGLINRLKDEDISPEEYIAFSEGLKEDIETNGDKNELYGHAAQQMELARAYEMYQRLMYRNGYVDFGDQVVLPLKLFRQRPEILKLYREMFDYILIDEFQDTNYAQFQLVKLLASEDRNLTCVGDDDQSIYKFRGAAISNILNFKSAYPDLKEVVLTRNFRSYQGILDMAYRLITHNNPDRLEFKESVCKKLVASRGKGSNEVNYLDFDSVSSEAEGVAERILKERQTAKREFGDFAILVRANMDAEPFIKVLKQKGIPFRFSGSRGLYSTEEIRLIISFLRVITNFTDDLSLFHLATSDIYGIKAADIIPLNTLARRRMTPLFYLIKEAAGKGADTGEKGKDAGENPYGGRSLLNDLFISEEGVISLSRLIADVEDYAQRALNVRVGEVLYSYLQGTGYLQRLVEDESIAGVERVRNIAKFFDILFNIELSLNIDRANTLVKHLDTLIDAGFDPPTAEADMDADAVSIMTVHKAKGLEFPVVFMVSLVSDRFPRRRRREAIEIPPPLVKDILPEGGFHLQEERRLFYVGITRAKDRLYLTSARDYGGVRTKKASPFLTEALDTVKTGKVSVKTKSFESISRFSPAEEEKRQKVLLSENVMTLSHYHIDDYLTCPLKYKYIHIMRIPVMPHHSVVYGRAVHEALSRYFKSKLEGRTISYKDLENVFKAAWRSEGFMSKEHEELRFKAGIDALKRFYEKDRENGINPSAVEKDFLIDMNRCKLKGRWDIIEERDGAPFIIDFKTSAVDEQKKADAKTRKNLQLFIYAFAYLKTFNRQAAGVELYFIESNIIGRTTVGEKEMEKVFKAVDDVLDGIGKKRFMPKPDVINCGYCVFNAICSGTAAK